MSFSLRTAGHGDLPQVAELMRGYQRWVHEALGVDLCFQDFEAELAGLPGAYVLPRGQLWLACDDVSHTALGVIAVKPLTDTSCEMKRLWVHDGAKGRGVGRALARTAIDFGRDAGYADMKLDTLRNRMPAAISLYRSVGFVETTAYVHNPEPDVLYMKLDL